MLLGGKLLPKLLLIFCNLQFCFRLFEFAVHEHYPPVQALEVHLENFQRTYFNPDEPLDPATLEARVTTLVKFFALCLIDDFAKTLTYIQVPQYYIWKGKNGWKRRKQGALVEGYPEIRMSAALGRMHTVSPTQEEAFCLRLLLIVVVGPTSFQDLKTVDGIVHETFKGACRARNLLGR